MAEIFKLIFISARPKQWLKNLSLFVGIAFSGWLFIPEKLLLSMAAFFIFCLVTSTIYIFNDLLDVSQDKFHPFKKSRPLASGKLPPPIAFFTITCGFFLSLFLASNLSFFFFLICFLYFILHIAYSFYFKNVAILDVLFIASGFILRVWAGAVAVNAHIGVWLLLCVTSFSLFLAVGKRRWELIALKKVAAKHRRSLLSYPENLLDLYISMFATSSWLTYALFTFSQPTAAEKGKFLSIMANLPKTLIAQKWLMITVPLAIYGVMRYLQLLYQKGQGDSPEKIILSDKPLIITCFLWLALTILMIYI